MLHQDRQRACSFGADAERYDRFRPTYPPALIDHLVGSSPGRVLDVGCGTGIVARLLAHRGCRVLGVEPDERMAAVARRHGIEVEPGTFEAWDPQGRTFDLVTSGQAWHWVDPRLGASKASSVLNPGGRLAVFWNIGNMPPELRARL
ncbi:MAG: class I SAM-dependent methyltransferase, partial [Acidimicrobiaceae bacterium]|nr:class I SAM-dependent methyltransferase [Acidimicrobiaceae bacterium]